MSSPLTAGFCELVYQSAETPENVVPVLQILSVKKINAPGASGMDRYRYVLEPFYEAITEVHGT